MQTRGNALYAAIFSLQGQNETEERVDKILSAARPRILLSSSSASPEETQLRRFLRRSLHFRS